MKDILKFIYSEKATKFCDIFTLLLTVCTVVRSKVNISQNFVAFSEYMNFKNLQQKICNLFFHSIILDFIDLESKNEKYFLDKILKIWP